MPPSRRITSCALALLLASPLLPAVRTSAAAAPEKAASPGNVRPNDNRRAAGRLRRGVLTVRLEARLGDWEPDDAGGPRLRVAAFAEEGGELHAPGPLLRVPAGTEIRATVRNRLAKPLWIYGMGAARGFAADSVVVAPGERREMRFTVTAPGTFYYAGRTEPGPVYGRIGEDSQLGGAIVVDPPGAPAKARDRIFVVSNWFYTDSTTVSGLGANATLALNGRSWPHTERLTATEGDSLHWRLVNLTPLEHPMHLHGFYFRVDGRGDGARDTLYTSAQRRHAVTELLMPGTTMAITWTPERGGNWVFHCHFASHISTRAALEQDRRMPTPGTPAAHAAHGAAKNHMEGLVLGIRVKPRRAVAAAHGPERPIRLLVRSRAAVYGDYAGYSYVLGGSAQEASRDTMPVPGPTLDLVRGQPVAINIVNQSHDPAAIHWHGIELESFPDGVPGWSGEGKTTLPMIPPGDSLTVRFTPPRAGTFMYHSHSNEFQQISSGLYGAIVVSEPAEVRDPATDRIVMFSDNGPTLNFFKAPPGTLLNGRSEPAPLELRAGVRHRLRLINIRTDYILHVALLDGDTPAEWRIVAKDGAPATAAQSRVQPATLTFAPGEIYDVEVTPRAGELTLRYQVAIFPNMPVTKVAVRVR